MVLKHNFYHKNVFYKFAIKKVLNILLYNKVIVRPFDLSVYQNESTIIKNNTLKIVIDNYYTFFYLASLKMPKVFLQFNKLQQFNCAENLNLTKKQRENLSYKYLVNNTKNYSGYSYKLKESIFKNYDIKYSSFKYKNIIINSHKIKFLQILKKKIDYFLFFFQQVTTILLLYPRLGGYKSYNHGVIGFVKYNIIKFFLILKNKAFFFKKVKVKLLLNFKLIFINRLKIIFYFKFKVFFAQNNFFIPFFMFYNKYKQIKNKTKIKYLFKRIIKKLEWKNLTLWKNSIALIKSNKLIERKIK